MRYSGTTNSPNLFIEMTCTVGTTQNDLVGTVNTDHLISLLKESSPNITTARVSG